MSVFDLTIPILVSGLATHILSTLAWMVLPHHKPEWRVLPVQDELQDWLTEKGVEPHQYIFPHTTDPAEMKSEAFKQKTAKCRGMLVLWPSPANMGVNIAMTLAFFFVAAFVIGYLASLGPGSSRRFLPGRVPVRHDGGSAHSLRRPVSRRILVQTESGDGSLGRRCLRSSHRTDLRLDVAERLT